MADKPASLSEALAHYAALIVAGREIEAEAFFDEWIANRG